MEPLEARFLGKQVEYPSHYNPGILVAVPREINREKHGIKSPGLPFTGVDVWHAWELGFLTLKGLPVAGVLKIIFPAQSTFLVESKSLKLYLNSFNMERYGATPELGVKQVIAIIADDLSRMANQNVEVQFFNNNTPGGEFDFFDFTILENDTRILDENFDQFNENPGLLTASSGSGGTLRVATHLLRSNCKITRQPDWGSVFMHVKASNLPGKADLLRYIVSLRDETHFHEEICELIYVRLMERFAPEELMVTCIYTRRGGIDICPARASHQHLLPRHLTEVKSFSKKLHRQ